MPVWWPQKPYRTGLGPGPENCKAVHDIARRLLLTNMLRRRDDRRRNSFWRACQRFCVAGLKWGYPLNEIRMPKRPNQTDLSPENASRLHSTWLRFRGSGQITTATLRTIVQRMDAYMHSLLWRLACADIENSSLFDRLGNFREVRADSCEGSDVCHRERARRRKKSL